MANFSDHQRKIRPLRYIRKNFDWHSYVVAHYNDIKYARNDEELRINCPKCDDRKHKCYVNPGKTVFHCFKCTFTTRKGKYDVFDFVALTEGIGKYAAIRRLLQEYKPCTPEEWEAALEGELDAVPEQPKKFKHPYLDGMPAVAKKLDLSQKAVAEWAKPFWHYLESRGLTSSEVTDMLDVHVVIEKSHEIFGHNGKLKGDIGRRILWPIYGGDNKLVSWQARSFETYDAVKYFNAPDTDISATLWPYVPPRPGSVVIICEGILDCLALRRLPKDYSAYACFSKHISADQIKLLKEWGATEVILFWDYEAKKEMKSAVKELKTNFDLFVPNFENWPDEDFDSGDCLKHPNGTDILCFAVDNAIGVNTLDYTKWELE